MIYHITTAEAWSKAQRGGLYVADSLAAEGFIHFSRREQVVGTANRFYRGQKNLLLLCVDPGRAAAEVRYEPADGQLFPHLYGPLETEAVIRVIPLSSDEQGHFREPPGL
ncbi:MAG: DUF952 domain-containing protein [Armatimonadetes bacterium]|nr:DUF952 domain-containing protein [Armatimonadota bacterium]